MSEDAARRQMFSMVIPRFHLFELEDQPWFPAVIRDLATDYLHFIEKRFALERPVVPLLAEALKATGQNQIVDLCSGGAGPIPRLGKALSAQGLRLSIILTDRFPNLPAFEETASQSGGTIAFRPEPVDAMSVPENLHGFRTMFNAFHHFRPEDAIAVLRDAAQARAPIGIFEIPDRSFRTLIPMLLLTPLLVALATPFIRPFRWRRLFWTYVIPLVPLTSWWDGIISQLRAYTPEELRRLAEVATVGDYFWRAGKTPIGSTPGDLTWLLGIPGSAAGERGAWSGGAWSVRGAGESVEPKHNDTDDSGHLFDDGGTASGP